MRYRDHQPAAPLRGTHASTSSLTRRAKSTSDRPAKPPNAFIFFRTAYSQAGRELAKTITELTSVSTRTALQQGNVSRDAAEAWRALGEDGRKEWEEKADMLRYEHEQKWGERAYRPSKYHLRVEGDGVSKTSAVVRSKHDVGRPSNPFRRPPSSKRKSGIPPQANPLASPSTSSARCPQPPTLTNPPTLQPSSSPSATPSPSPPSQPSASVNPYNSWIGYPPPYYYYAYYPVTVMASSSLAESSSPSISEERAKRVPEERGEGAYQDYEGARCEAEKRALAANMLLRADDLLDVDTVVSEDISVQRGAGIRCSDGEEWLGDLLSRRRSSPPPACIDPRLLLE